MLKLTKKGDKYWLFEDSEIGLFSPSKFTINLELNEIVIVYENGLKSKRYNVSDCEIYDLGELTPFTTSSGDLFMQKLEELNCPCFQKNENIFNISGGAWGDITGTLSDQTDLQDALDASSKKSQSLLFQVPTNGTALNNTQMNFCQSRFNGQSVFGALGLVFGAGITETSGVINLSDFSDKATPEITPNYISQVKHIKFSYSRNVAESGANTNVVIRVMAESKYLNDMQLIADYNLVSTSVLSTQENKVDIPVLTHLDLSAYSNIKWCIRTNNATAQTFNFIRLNVDIEEV